MDSGKARDIFEKYASAVAYVEIEGTNGERHIGSAFHVGEGVFVTARHVVDGNKVTEVGMTERTDIELTGKEADEAKTFVQIGDDKRPVHTVDNGIMQIAVGPYPHSHENVDVAVFKVREIDPYTPVIPLGSHLDDWLGTSDFVLSEAIVLGYPPIPMTSAPVLFGARAEVNAQVDRYDTPHVHFILSSMPRGGFSGGVAISEYDFVLGVITTSLLPDGHPTELGLMTVVGAEPIYECLAEHKLLPNCQEEGWQDYWNTSRLSFSSPGTEKSNSLIYGPYREAPEESSGDLAIKNHEKSVRIVADVQLFDDGKRVALTMSCKDIDMLQELITVLRNELADYSLIQSEARPQGQRFDIESWDSSAGQHGLAAARAVAARLIQHGYVPQGHESPDGTDLLPQ